MENLENKELEKEVSILKNKIIISGGISFVLLLGVLFYAYPQISAIWNLKTELEQKISIYEQYKKNGISYNDFMNITKDTSVKKILAQDGGQFFLNNLTNTTDVEYLSFLKQKENYINEMNKSGFIDERNQSISKVLPSYTEGFSVDGNMTDLTFVNYVESLLRTFQLRTSSKIGIENLVLVEDMGNTNIATQLFYIPLKLDIVGRKADVVEFLYFLQNVWVVASIDDNNSLVFHNDNIISRVIAWQKRNLHYNIYENKIADIASIELPSYIDTSSTIRNTTMLSPEGFLNFLRTGSERNDEYQVVVDLKFYVKWLPTYKVELFVQEVIKKYNTMSTQVKTILANAKNRKTMLLNGNIIEIISILKTIDVYLDDIKSDVQRLEVGINQNVNIHNLYKEASDLHYELWNLDPYISSIQLEENKK